MDGDFSEWYKATCIHAKGRVIDQLSEGGDCELVFFSSFLIAGFNGRLGLSANDNKQVSIAFIRFSKSASGFLSHEAAEIGLSTAGTIWPGGIPFLREPEFRE
jgi:hypothetical protein